MGTPSPPWLLVEDSSTEVSTVTTSQFLRLYLIRTIVLLLLPTKCLALLLINMITRRRHLSLSRSKMLVTSHTSPAALPTTPLSFLATVPPTPWSAVSRLLPGLTRVVLSARPL